MRSAEVMDQAVRSAPDACDVMLVEVTLAENEVSTVGALG
jgi:hypothetical protein